MRAHRPSFRVWSRKLCAGKHGMQLSTCIVQPYQLDACNGGFSLAQDVPARSRSRVPRQAELRLHQHGLAQRRSRRDHEVRHRSRTLIGHGAPGHLGSNVERAALHAPDAPDADPHRTYALTQSIARTDGRERHSPTICAHRVDIRHLHVLSSIPCWLRPMRPRRAPSCRRLIEFDRPGEGSASGGAGLGYHTEPTPPCCQCRELSN
mmetsp:Transcript_29389/g.90073  ORF Transcript_29389/g.90073 Transcript_29389/m.90073 type:complete len:207 (-) Transcript_29389:377-997(-)